MRIMHLSRMALMLSNFLIPVIKSQQKKGHYVCGCTADDPEVEQLRNEGIDIFVHNIKKNLNIFGYIKAAFGIKRILQEQHIEVLITHNTFPSVASRIAARLAHVPCVIYFAHGLACWPSHNPIIWTLYYWIEKLLGYFFTDAIIVMNDYDEELCKTRHMIKNISQIYRISGVGVDLTRFSVDESGVEKRNLCKELSVPKETRFVICVARLGRMKGVLDYIEAAKKICDKQSDICFLLVGFGPLKSKIKKIISDNNLGDKIKLLGWRDDVHQLIQASDIFVLPTIYCEGLPVSIMEAMACSKPVVATYRRGCVDTVIDGQTGFLIPAKNAKALAEKILMLYNNETMRLEMGRAGRKRVEEYFELNYCTNKIADVLDKAIN